MRACVFPCVLDHHYFRAAAASLLTLKNEGATLEVVTCVKRPPGIIEVCSYLLVESSNFKDAINTDQVGLGIGDETKIGEAEAAFTSVQDPKVTELTRLQITNYNWLSHILFPACGTL